VTVSFAVLGSGSGGNCTVVCLNGQDQERFVLIDAGLSPRATAKRLGQFGITLDQISDIFLTHLDRDHFCPTWANAAKRHDIVLHAHQRQQSRLADFNLDYSRVNLFDRDVSLSSDTHLDSILLAHDQLGTVGYVLDHAGTRMGFATDLGRVSSELLERFTNLHALAIESNYDKQMQLASERPAQLKRRIMGGRGHLSNEQALAAVVHVAEQASLSHIALLHLSRQCNCPTLITSLYARCAPHLMKRLTITNQYAATPMLDVVQHHAMHSTRVARPAEQLSLF
jgi:phosphoribosyl 1,2-cyclic phosphodiesterase